MAFFKYKGHNVFYQKIGQGFPLIMLHAMFGIGLNSDLHGDALKAVELINASGLYVIAVDIPSGVHADSGAVMGAAVKADATLHSLRESLECP